MTQSGNSSITENRSLHENQSLEILENDDDANQQDIELKTCIVTPELEFSRAVSEEKNTNLNSSVVSMNRTENPASFQPPSLLRTASKYADSHPARHRNTSAKVLSFADEHGACLQETCFTPTLYYSKHGVARKSGPCIPISQGGCCTTS